MDLTVRLRDERMNRIKAEVVIIDDGKENDAFWAALGGKGDIQDEVRYHLINNTSTRLTRVQWWRRH